MRHLQRRGTADRRRLGDAHSRPGWRSRVARCSTGSTCRRRVRRAPAGPGAARRRREWTVSRTGPSGRPTEVARRTARDRRGLRAPPGQKVDDRFGPPSQLLVSATPSALLREGEGRGTDLTRTVALDAAVGDGVLHVAARAASCDAGAGEGAACHLHQQDWGVPVRVAPGGPRHPHRSPLAGAEPLVHRSPGKPPALPWPGGTRTPGNRSDGGRPRRDPPRRVHAGRARAVPRPRGLGRRHPPLHLTDGPHPARLRLIPGPAPTRPRPTLDADRDPAPGTVPPPWLGTRVLPEGPDGYAEARADPARAAHPSLHHSPTTLDPLPGDGFAARTTAVPGAVLARSTWDPACPVAAADLRWVRVAFRGFDGERHTGELLVQRRRRRRPGRRVPCPVAGRLPDRGDAVSRGATSSTPHPTGDGNNTSAFVCRPVTRGLDEVVRARLRPRRRRQPVPQPLQRGDDLVLPELASAYVDRGRRAPGMVRPGGAVVRGVRRDRVGVGRRLPLAEGLPALLPDRRLSRRGRRDPRRHHPPRVGGWSTTISARPWTRPHPLAGSSRWCRR